MTEVKPIWIWETKRFLDIHLTSDSNLTTGKVYQAVIAQERKGEYLGKTVQIIPHITNEIIRRIVSVASKPVEMGRSSDPDVCVIELGGTIGDIESMPFVEALRQLQLQVKPENFCIVHVSMVPMVHFPLTLLHTNSFKFYDFSSDPSFMHYKM